ncbi:AAA family ATPase, partial [Chloroflexota bacterium]
MAIITISRGSYSRGKEIAEKVADRLGYECVAREALLEASEHFDIPEAKLIRAVHDAPSILDRFAHGKEKYVAYIQAVLTRYVQKDNVVYHGLAGHFLLQGISHVLKVRITAATTDRVQVIMERDNVGEKEALHILQQDDEQRKRWSHYLYGIDTTDPSLYDLMLCIEKISVDGAVDIICSAVGAKSFQTTAQSQKAMDDLVLACEVRSRLIEIKPDVEVRADDGLVFIVAEFPVSRQEALTQEITRVAKTVEG